MGRATYEEDIVFYLQEMLGKYSDFSSCPFWSFFFFMDARKSFRTWVMNVTRKKSEDRNHRQNFYHFDRKIPAY